MITVVVAALALQAVDAPAVEAPAVESQAVEAPAAPAQGKIIMYRGSTLLGAAIACPIRYKGQELVELGRGKYAEWSVAPGRYILANRTASVEVTVDPGETRYVRCQIKAGFMAGRADLQIVDEESFMERRGDLEEKTVTVPAASQDAPASASSR